MSPTVEYVINRNIVVTVAGHILRLTITEAEQLAEALVDPIRSARMDVS